MYYFCKKVNFIPLLFIFNIISLFQDNYALPYAITITYFITLTLKLLNKRINKLSINKDIIIIFILFFIMIFTTIMNIDNIEKFLKLIKLFILIINSVIGLECALLFGKEYINKGFSSINNIMTILNIEGIFEFIRRSNIYVEYIKNVEVKSWSLWSFGTDLYRNFSVFTNPIVYANILILSFWINHFLCKNKTLKNINYVLILINLYATKSRSSWIGFSITLLLYIVSKNLHLYKKRMLSIKHSIYLILLMFIIVISVYTIPTIFDIIYSIFERFSSLYTKEGMVSATQRLGTIEYIINEFSGQNIFYMLIGNGFRDVSEMMKSTTIVLDGFTTTDNQFLSILWEFGIIGLILNIIIILKSIKIIFNTLRDNQAKYSNYLFISISVPMFFYEMYGWYIMAQIYFFILGLLYINFNINIDNQNLVTIYNNKEI